MNPLHKKRMPDYNWQFKGKRIMKKLLSLLLILFFVSNVASSQTKKEFGVYEYVVRESEGTIDQISTDLTRAFTQAGWIVVTAIDASVPDKCPYKARVIILYNLSYMKNIMDANRKTGPYAIIDRINVFNDEQGVHVSVINPHSINRTVLMDDTKYYDLSEAHLQSLRSVIISAVKGKQSDKQYGELRDEGFIGKTMGIVAGGRFDEKIENEFVVPKGNLIDVAAKVGKSLTEKGKKWGTHDVYRIHFEEYGIEIIGITGTPMDSKSFEIVKSGSDDSREDFKCPGLAHAGAYPFEVVVSLDNDGVKVSMVAAMFRMKMYFEDAGTWAFMKNMTMPGSIADEIMDRISSALKEKNNR
jgi:hypothetical protein